MSVKLIVLLSCLICGIVAYPPATSYYQQQPAVSSGYGYGVGYSGATVQSGRSTFLASSGRQYGVGQSISSGHYQHLPYESHIGTSYYPAATAAHYGGSTYGAVIAHQTPVYQHGSAYGQHAGYHAHAPY